MIRTLCRGYLVVVAILGSVSVASAQDKLVWKAFDGKDPLYQEMTTETTQKMTVMGMEVKQIQKQTFFLSWTPTDKGTADAWVVKQKIIGVKMNINIGGNSIDFSSMDKEQPTNPLTDFFKALVDAEFTLTIDKKTMTVSKIEGRDAFVNGLVKANPQLEPLLKQILSEEALKQMADPTFAVIPKGGELPKDGKWGTEKPIVLNMGPIGKYETTYKYTLDEAAWKKDKDKAIINVETTLTYTKPDGKGGALPFTIKDGTLSTKKPGTGKIVFDVKEGKIVSSDIEIELSGNLQIEIAGQLTDVKLEQTQKSTVKTLKDNPVK